MSQVQDLLRKIFEIKKDIGDVIWPSADPISLERLRAYMRRTFRMELPHAYVELVSSTDGLEFNSTMIFGVNTHQNPYLSSVEEINEVLVGTPRQHAFFGSTEHDLLAYCLQDDTWRVLDRTTLTPLRDFQNFDRLFLYILDKACDILSNS